MVLKDILLPTPGLVRGSLLSEGNAKPSGSGYPSVAHKSSGKCMQRTDLSLHHREPDSGTMREGPGIIIFNTFPGVLVVVVKSQALRNPDPEAQKHFTVSQRVPLTSKCSYFKDLPTVCNCFCDLGKVSFKFSGPQFS